ncbi:hypothetical protein L1987_82815 [Smallanthus sonchifolius]|uniref:Uncharacterized protein n=1 Tax=Smallanthus sonchifolius TaxID=185202 RepID=A0ACB8YB92_9ASTR|nr:hypothetical protein L1987_82815 [Smallanthus sonchifolius]
MGGLLGGNLVEGEGALSDSTGGVLEESYVDLEKEVEETIRVGVCVGIEMEGFENQVHKLIQGEMEAEGLKEFVGEIMGKDLGQVGGGVKALARRLVLLKLGIKKWRANMRDAEGKLEADMGKVVDGLDCLAEARKLSVDEVKTRALMRSRLKQVEIQKAKDFHQKARSAEESD